MEIVKRIHDEDENIYNFGGKGRDEFLGKAKYLLLVTTNLDEQKLGSRNWLT